MLDKHWVPEIMYEDSEDGMTSKIPFIMVPQNQKMPGFLFIFESRETGEFEPDSEGNQLPIIDMELHQYADMSTLKEKLSREDFDKVRKALGLKPLEAAARQGTKITDNIRKNLSSLAE
jgi:hypothetical protein